jgi:hypothetical protein
MSSGNLSFQAISPLIAHKEVRGRNLEITFRCPISGEEHKARHNVPVDRSTGAQVKRRVEQSMAWSVRSAVANTLRSVFGTGMVGRIAGDAAWAVLSEVGRNSGESSLSSAEEQAGILAAFEQVRPRFAWDPHKNAWVSAKAAQELLGDFERQLQQHPPTHPYDRHIMARMLVEIARSDGRLGDEEAGWLTECITPDLGSTAELAARPPLTSAELGTCSPGGIRESLLLMAWTMALLDEELAQAEQARLKMYAQGLGLPGPRVEAVRRMAQRWILDQALERMIAWGGHDAHARDSLFQLADRIGVPRAEAEAAEAELQRRLYARG